MDITLDDLNRWLRDLPDRLKDVAVRSLQGPAGARGLAVLQRAGDVAPPASPRGSIGIKNTGEYRRSWRKMPIDGGVMLYNAAAHAEYVRGGRRPGAKMPPLKVIARWAELKLGLSAAEAAAAAFPIAKAIGARGLAARDVVATSTKQVVREVVEEVRAAIAKNLRVGKR